MPAPLPVQEEQPTGIHESLDKEWTVRLPTGWRVKPAKEETALMAFDITVTGDLGTGYGRITLFWIQGMQMAKAQPFTDRAAQLERYRGEEAVIGLSPLPHLEFRYSQSGRRFAVILIYRVIEGRGLSMVCTIDEGVMAQIRPGLFEAVESISTRLTPWPPVPDGYREKIRGAYRYLIHPDFEGNPSTIHTLLAKEEKSFMKVHGPFDPDPGPPPTILLHNPGFELSSSFSDAPPGALDAWCDFTRKWLFLSTLPKKKSMERASLVREMILFFYGLRYGNPMPHWLCVGEGELALERTLIGKNFPYVSTGRYDALPQNPQPFDKVSDGLEEENRLSFVHHALVYTALFQYGDKKVQGAFKGFLAEYHLTGDWEEAANKHLLSLDQAALRSAALQLVQKRIKPAKKK